MMVKTYEFYILYMFNLSINYIGASLSEKKYYNFLQTQELSELVIFCGTYGTSYVYKYIYIYIAKTFYESNEICVRDYLFKKKTEN